MIFYLQCGILIALGILMMLAMCDFDLEFLAATIGVILAATAAGAVFLWCLVGVVEHFDSNNPKPPPQQTIERP